MPIVHEERLARIEDKLDRASEAITALARMEERMISLFKRMDKYDENLTKLHEAHDVDVKRLQDRVSELEKSVLQRNVVFNIVDKIFWLGVGGLVAYIVRST